MPYFILITRPLHTQRTIRRMTARAWKRTIQVHLLFQLEFSLGLKRGSCCSIFSFVDHCLSLYCLLSLIISMVRYIYGTLYLWYVISMVRYIYGTFNLLFLYQMNHICCSVVKYWYIRLQSTALQSNQDLSVARN